MRGNDRERAQRRRQPRIQIVQRRFRQHQQRVGVGGLGVVPGRHDADARHEIVALHNLAGALALAIALSACGKDDPNAARQQLVRQLRADEPGDTRRQGGHRAPGGAPLSMENFRKYRPMAVSRYS